jgi:hypothetical protein
MVFLNFHFSYSYAVLPGIPRQFSFRASRPARTAKGLLFFHFSSPNPNITKYPKAFSFSLPLTKPAPPSSPRQHSSSHLVGKSRVTNVLQIHPALPLIS